MFKPCGFHKKFTLDSLKILLPKNEWDDDDDLLNPLFFIPHIKNDNYLKVDGKG